MRSWKGSLQKVLKVLRSQPNALENGAQRARFDGFRSVNGDNGSAQEVGLVTEHNMGAVLTLYNEAGFFKCTNEASAGNLRECAQALTSTSVRMVSSGGMGRWSS